MKRLAQVVRTSTLSEHSSEVHVSDASAVRLGLLFAMEHAEPRLAPDEDTIGLLANGSNTFSIGYDYLGEGRFSPGESGSVIVNCV